MTREHWNVTYAVCWLASIALAYAVYGPVAALAVFFLPAFLIASWIVLLGRFGIDWDRRPSAIRGRDEPPSQPPGAN